MPRPNALIKKLFPGQAKLAESGKCPVCGRPVDPSKFRDDLSRREFNISGLRPDCQDEAFEGEEDERKQSNRV